MLKSWQRPTHLLVPVAISPPLSTIFALLSDQLCPLKILKEFSDEGAVFEVELRVRVARHVQKVCPRRLASWRRAQKTLKPNPQAIGTDKNGKRIDLDSKTAKTPDRSP